MNYAALIEAIEEVVKTNGNKEITGANLQAVLVTMVRSLGANYTFAGVATPATSAGTPDQNVFYIGGAGTYANFGSSITIPKGSIGVFAYNGSWSNTAISVDLPTYININELVNHPAAYANAATALADVPAIYRRKGVKCVYYDDTTQLWIEMLCIDDFGGNDWWTEMENWVIEGPIRTELSEGGTSARQMEIAGEKRANMDDFLNVNVWNATIYPYETKEDARLAVPARKRKVGLTITYLLNDGWITEQFTAIHNWATDSVWVDDDNWVAPVSVSQNTETGKKELLIGSDTALVIDNNPAIGSENIVASNGVADADRNLFNNGDSDLSSSIFNSHSFRKYELTELSDLVGYTINPATGEIAESSISSAKVSYIAVKKGDVINITVIPSGVNRVAFGLFTSVEDGAKAIMFKAYAGPVENGFDKYITISQDGFFAIYTLNTYSLYQFKPSYLIKNYTAIYDESGLEAPNNASRCCTDFIEITNISRLVCSRPKSTASSSGYGMCFYDSQKNYISGIPELTGASEAGYVIEEITIPQDAAFVRFTFWKDTQRGFFWFGDPTKDAVLNKLITSRNASVFVNGLETSFKGAGSTFVYGERFDVDSSKRVIKVILKDTNYPVNNTGGGDLQTMFGVYAYDSNDVGTVLVKITRVGFSNLQKEYTIVLPEGTTYLKLGGRCNGGYSCICDVVDVTNEYRYKRELTAEDYFISSVARLRAYVQGNGRGVLCLRKKNLNSDFIISATSFVVDNEHTSTPVEALSFDDNASYATFTMDNINYIGIYGRHSDNADMTTGDAITFAQDYEVVIFNNKEFTQEISGEPLILNAFTINNPSYKAETDFFTIQKDRNIVVHLPSWVRILINHGVRTTREDTGYYYDGDVIDIEDLTGSGMYIRFANATTSNYRFTSDILNRWIKQGLIRLSTDSRDGNIIERNHESEKYIGAIKATPNVNETLPLLVHVSDIHGDVKRFNNAFDFADYIKADLLINTGDNYYYNSGDGMDYHKEVVLAHKTDFANCLGNHDTYDSSVANILAKNITPFATKYHYYKEVSGGVPVVTDKAYYYKDLAEKKLRLITLDIYDDTMYSYYRARISKTQIDWFIDTLNTTPQDYGVIVMFHAIPHWVYPISGKTDFNDSTMSEGQAAWDSDYMTNGKLEGMPVCKIIDAFISRTAVSGTYTQKNAEGSETETISYSADFTSVANGVEFICYLNGHTHRDLVGYVSDCVNNQLNINICSTSPLSQSSGIKTASDIMRENFGSNEDAINVYTINRTDKTVGIARVGSNLSKDLRDRKVMFVSYADSI